MRLSDRKEKIPAFKQGPSTADGESIEVGLGDGLKWRRLCSGYLLTTKLRIRHIMNLPEPFWKIGQINRLLFNMLRKIGPAVFTWENVW